MTCQWCKHFKRKADMPICCRPEGDGRTVKSSGGSASDCPYFDARVNCTTCEYRCSPEEKRDLRGKSACRKWRLRRLSSWGGSRYRAISAPGHPAPAGN